MELTSIRYFVALAHELHFRKAAEKLHITQAPLSSAIKKLEDELGTPLFTRTSRSVQLSEAGKIFLPECEHILARTQTAISKINDFISGNSCKLRIGYNEPAINTFLPQVLAGIRKSEPELQLELQELETGQQQKLLENGTLDIGFMRPFGREPAGLSTRLVFQENYLLAMRKDHLLASLGSVKKEDLAGQQIILFAREVNPAVYDHLVAILSSDLPEPPYFRQDARNKSSMLAMVHAGFGAAVIPASCMHGAPDEVISRPLDIPLPPVNIMAVWEKNNHSAALKRFLKHLPPEKR